MAKTRAYRIGRHAWTRRVSILAVGLLVACGDGGGKGGSGSPVDPNGEDPGPVAGELTEEQRMAAIHAAEEYFESLLAQRLPREEVNEALVEWLRERPEFRDAGTGDLSSVWAIFVDGMPYAIANNRDPVPPSSAVRTAYEPGTPGAALLPGPGSRAEATELPEPLQVRLLHSLGPGFTGQAPIDDLAEWFRNAGYTVVAGNEGDARIEKLRQVKDDAFFYFNTHGATGTLDTGERFYMMGTSSISSEVKNRFKDIADDLLHRRLVQLTAPNGLTKPDGTPDSDTRYAITYRFVEQYMEFGENSVVFFNVCGSTHPSPFVTAFRDAVMKKKAGVYVGWSSTISSDPAFRGVRYFVDRLLGANEYRAEDPKQRPFPWAEVLEEMKREGLARDPLTGAELTGVASGRNDPGVGLLAPSIRLLLANQWDDELTIYGIFGEKPEAKVDGEVSIDDGSGPTPMEILDWKPTEIKVRLPPSGAGSAGDVVVTVRGHQSNARRLMSWTGKVVFTVRDGGSLTLRAELDLDVRQDPASIRMKPGETPTPVPQPFFSSPNKRSSGKLTASGEWRRTSGDCTYTTSYGGSKPLAYPEGGTGYGAFAAVDPDRRTMTAMLALLVTYTKTFLAQCGGESTTTTETRELSIPMELRDTGGPVVFDLDDLLSMPAGRREKTVRSDVGAPSATAMLEWGRIEAKPAYDGDQHR